MIMVKINNALMDNFFVIKTQNWNWKTSHNLHAISCVKCWNSGIESTDCKIINKSGRGRMNGRQWELLIQLLMQFVCGFVFYGLTVNPNILSTFAYTIYILCKVFALSLLCFRRDYVMPKTTTRKSTIWLKCALV